MRFPLLLREKSIHGTAKQFGPLIYQILTLATFALLSTNTAGQPAPGSLDPRFDAGLPPNGTITSVVIRPDGKIIAGGFFTQFSGEQHNYLVQLNPDGTLDEIFGKDSAPDSRVRSLALQPDGKLILAGDFQKIGGIARKGCARLNPDGSLDLEFNPVASVEVPTKIVLVGDGRIMLAGYTLARLTESGRSDTTFSFSPNIYWYSGFMGFSDAQIFANGQSIVIGNFGPNGVARLNHDGTWDRTFDAGIGEHALNSSMPAAVQALALDTIGRILVGGSFIHVQGHLQPEVARLNADGSFDPTFVPQLAGGIVQQIVVEPTTRALLLGNFTTVNGAPSSGLVRVLDNGQLDPSFQPQISHPTKVVLQPDGNIIAVAGKLVRLFGGIPPPSSVPTILDQPSSVQAKEGENIPLTVSVTSLTPVVFQWQKNGQDLAVATNTTLQLENVSLNEAGAYRIVVRNAAGSTTSEVAEVQVIAAPKTAGALDLSLDTHIGPNGPVNVAVVQPDGKIIIGGAFTEVNGIARNQLARIAPDGTLDPTFVPNVPVSGADANSVSALLLQPDGRILVAGARVPVPWIPSRQDFRGTYYVARFTADGRMDRFPVTSQTFTTSLPTVVGLALQSDGKIIYGLSLSPSFTLTASNAITRLTPYGSVDPTFNAAIPHQFPVVGLHLQPDGKLLVRSSPSYSEPSIIQLNTDGSLDSELYRVKVQNWAFQSNGAILITGSFPPGYTNNFVRFQPDGALDPDFHPPLFQEVKSMAVQNDGKILVAYRGTSGAATAFVARLNADGTRDPSFGVTRAGDVVPGLFNPEVLSLQLDHGGGLLVAGSFTSINAVPRNNLARLWNEGAAAAEPLTLMNPYWDRSGFHLKLNWIDPQKQIFLEYKNSLNDSYWTALPPFAGDQQDLSENPRPARQRFYRVRIE